MVAPESVRVPAVGSVLVGIALLARAAHCGDQRSAAVAAAAAARSRMTATRYCVKAERGAGASASSSSPERGRGRPARDARSCRAWSCLVGSGPAADGPADAPVFPDVMARCAFPDAVDGPAQDRTWSWRTRHTPSRTIRDHLHNRGIRSVIPIPAEQRGHRLRRGSRGGRRQPWTARGTSSATQSSDASTAQAVARHRRPLREDRDHLPGRTAHRGHLPLVRTMTQTKGPSRGRSWST